MRTTTEPKEKALQARVSEELAERIALIAKARGKSTSALIREVLEKEVRVAENDLRNLRRQLREKHRAEERKLGLLPEDYIDDAHLHKGAAAAAPTSADESSSAEVPFDDAGQSPAPITHPAPTQTATAAGDSGTATDTQGRSVPA